MRYLVPVRWWQSLSNNRIINFVVATWKAVREVFSDVQMKGCHFHFSQAIHRNLQQFGLQREYNKKEELYSVVRMVFALALLPTSHIATGYAYIKAKADSLSLPSTDRLFQYFERYWLGQSYWGPSDWSMFGMPTRTNNDLEGWHTKLNRSLPYHKPNLYLIITLLDKESRDIPRQVRQVEREELTRRQAKGTKQRQKVLDKLWGKLEARSITTSGFLKNARNLMPTF